MVIYDNTAALSGTTDRTATATASADPDPDPAEGEGDGEAEESLLARLAAKARTLADLVDPFVSILTLIVHSATVAALIRSQS